MRKGILLIGLVGFAILAARRKSGVSLSPGSNGIYEGDSHPLTLSLPPAAPFPTTGESANLPTYAPEETPRIDLPGQSPSTQFNVALDNAINQFNTQFKTDRTIVRGNGREVMVTWPDINKSVVFY